MKNPMTLQEQHQALDDNAAGHPMQRRIINSGAPWQDRDFTWEGYPLDFSTNEYRRKPRTSEEILKMAIAWWLGDGKQKFIGAPAWVFAARELVEPEPEEKNPWHKVPDNEWPECKPGDDIVIRWSDGTESRCFADAVSWHCLSGIDWRYAEDKK
jgi:hypothetical protein